MHIQIAGAEINRNGTPATVKLTESEPLASENYAKGHIELTIMGETNWMHVRVSLDELTAAIQAFNHLRGRQC